MTPIAERVAAGVQLLDEKGPEGWRDRIDVESLSLASPIDCVLGQVYGHPLPRHKRWGSYLKAMIALDLTPHMAQDYGFDLEYGDSKDFGLLTDEWVGVIASQHLSI